MAPARIGVLGLAGILAAGVILAPSTAALHGPTGGIVHPAGGPVVEEPPSPDGAPTEPRSAREGTWTDRTGPVCVELDAGVPPPARASVHAAAGTGPALDVIASSTVARTCVGVRTDIPTAPDLEPPRAPTGSPAADVVERLPAPSHPEPAPDRAWSSRSLADRSTAAAGPAVEAPSNRLLELVLGAALAASLAAAVLYRRLSEDEVLTNDLRRRMLDLVADAPGVNATVLADRLDVALTTVLYHGRILADHGHVVVERRSSEHMYFEAGSVDPVERELVCVLKQETKAELIELLARRPGLNLSEAARRLDRHRSTVMRHADDLVARGLVEDRLGDGGRRLSLVERVRCLLADRHGPA